MILVVIEAVACSATTTTVNSTVPYSIQSLLYGVSIWLNWPIVESSQMVFFLSTELSIGIKGVGRLAVYLFVDFQNESITILCEPLLSGHYHLSSAHIRAIICLMTHTHTHKYTHQC